MNTQGLIDAVVQQTMVFIAHLATAGGLRTPLVGVADQVFMELTRELQNQGVRKKVIADMFGMALRTYHRRVHARQGTGCMLVAPGPNAPWQLLPGMILAETHASAETHAG
jgi:hypothetical protein